MLMSEFLDEVNETEHMDLLDAGQTGGVYKVSPKGTPTMLAVFKPEDQEGFERRGIPCGSGAFREEAAYMLDRHLGSVAGVPVTTRAEVPARKLSGLSPSSVSPSASPATTPSTSASETPIDFELLEEDDVFERQTSRGAVQRFVPMVVGAAEDFGMPRQLEDADKFIATETAQQVASFDIMLCNTDRHAGNLLFQREVSSPASEDCARRYVPVPIDHGCVLPRWWAVGEANFDAWIDWPQTQAPCQPVVLSTISEAFEGMQAGVQLLDKLGLEPAAQATYRIAVALLRECTVRHGLPLTAVGRLITREAFEIGKPSWLEEQIAECAVAAGGEWSWTENSYGDKVGSEPTDPQAWPPDGMIERLEQIFASEETKLAGQRALQIV